MRSKEFVGMVWDELLTMRNKMRAVVRGECDWRVSPEVMDVLITSGEPFSTQYMNLTGSVPTLFGSPVECVSSLRSEAELVDPITGTSHRVRFAGLEYSLESSIAQLKNLGYFVLSPRELIEVTLIAEAALSSKLPATWQPTEDERQPTDDWFETMVVPFGQPRSPKDGNVRWILHQMSLDRLKLKALQAVSSAPGGSQYSEDVEHRLQWLMGRGLVDERRVVTPLGNAILAYAG